VLTDSRMRVARTRRSPRARAEAGFTSLEPRVVDSLTSYDEAPYQSFPFPQAHPARMAVIATLLGVDAVPLQNAKVLEIGCAAGGHLIPLAEQLPQSSLLGIDASRRQIDQGQHIITMAGLNNIELRHENILDFADQGPFDYIIAHGVYSWTPPEVRQRMMEIIKSRLSARGVAYVSYNIYPGWRLRGLARDVMAYATRGVADPLEKPKQARRMAEEVVAGMKAAGHATSANLEAELERAAAESDDVIMHDYLEKVNEPVYFHEFARQASNVGLQYLGEAHFPDMFVHRFSKTLRNMVLSHSDDPLEREQFLDFALVRTFRQSLLCHADVPLDRSLRPERLLSLRVASNAKPDRHPVAFGDATEVSFQRSKSHLKTCDPLLKTVMMLLVEAWPNCLPIVDLLRQARSLLSEGGPNRETEFEADLKRLLPHLMHGYGASMLDLRPAEPGCVHFEGGCPRSSPLARLQAELGVPIVGRLHEVVTLDVLERQVLSFCDGTRDLPALARAVEAQQDQTTSSVKDGLPGILERLARQALLVDVQG